MRPSYLIVGTMKGGTTALHDFICKHPDVVPPKQKEIHYFSLFPHKGIDWYLEHFQTTKNKITGEASPTYFHAACTPGIPRLIKAFNPQMKLILIVRDPIERAVSHFYHFRNVNKIKQIIDIDINEFFYRPHSAMLRQTTQLDFYLNQIITFSLYSRKLKAYLSVFDRDQILVIDSAELKNSARTVMTRVFDHLGVENYYHDVFQQVRYSSGKTSKDLSDEVRDHLREVFDVDYKKFRQRAGI
jgi:hypothetical protein